MVEYVKNVNVTTKPKSAIIKRAGATAQPKESLEKNVIDVISLITIMGILSRTLAIVSTCPGPPLTWFPVMIHYLENKVGVVDFANAQGMVMF